MKTLLRAALAGAVTYAVVKILISARSGPGAGQSTVDAAPESAEAGVPTLHGVQDAEPQRPEPLRDRDLNVAQNAPF